ncbi:MAG: hypothetical protein ACR2P8_15605 [Myxococcota bacterium]
MEAHPLHVRILAGLALAALIAAGLHCSVAIYTDRADFSAGRRTESEVPGARPEPEARPGDQAPRTGRPALR